MPPPTRLSVVTYPTAPYPMAFPGSDPLDEQAVERCRAVSTQAWPRPDTVFCAPEPAARQAADALGLTPAVADALAAPALGRWAGRALDSVAAAEPESLAAWLSDPHSAPHGGESLASLIARIGRWLDDLACGRTLVVVHPITARAAATYALDADPRTMLHLDVPPLSLVRMSRTDRWRLQRLARLSDEHP